MDLWLSAQSASPGGRHRGEKEIEMRCPQRRRPDPTTVAAGEWRADRGTHRVPVASGQIAAKRVSLGSLETQ